MRRSQSHAALHSALQFIRAADIPAEHRTVLLEVLTQALNEQEANASARPGEMPPASGWQPHEIVLLQSFLEDKVAKSWQHADELVMQLAAQLHRHPRSIQAKATELGLAPAVDYRVARALTQAEE